MPTKIVKSCHCGRNFTKSEWERLLVPSRNAGRAIYSGIVCEFRNCDRCGSTLTYIAPQIEKRLRS